MQSRKEQSAASQAKSHRKRVAYHNAINSKTAGLLGISSTKPSSSQAGAVDSSQLERGDRCDYSYVQPTTLSDDDEEENSYDKNDDMDENDFYDDGHIELPISNDGRIEISDDDGVSARKADSYRTNLSSSTIDDTSSSLPSSASEFTSFLSASSLETSKNELGKYLDEENESLLNKSFDVLLCWKLNAHRYPVMAKMAKNFLSIPATSVSSESTFSTGGRVLDDYRSSLKPAMVEALVCASSWIKGSQNDVKVSMNVEPDDDDDVETISFPKSVVGSN